MVCNKADNAHTVSGK